MSEQIPSAEIDKIETKAAGGEVAQAFDEFMQAFEAFKETNDERLNQIEKRLASDAVTEEKLERISRALDEHKQLADQLALKAARPALGGTVSPRNGAALQHKAAFEGYMRSGEASGLRALEGKALSVGSDPDGGYLVPEETEASVMRSLKDISPIRAIASERQVSGSVYKKPFS
ncbi:MAG: phage major capsid protein, partial [Alphaproteobacteria bacterium]